MNRSRGLPGHPFALGRRTDAWIRSRLHRGRRTWLLTALFYYVAFELLAPFVVLAQQRYVRVIEGVAFAVLATGTTWIVRRSR
jgi:hypothetical protein